MLGFHQKGFAHPLMAIFAAVLGLFAVMAGVFAIRSSTNSQPSAVSGIVEKVTGTVNKAAPNYILVDTSLNENLYLVPVVQIKLDIGSYVGKTVTVTGIITRAKARDKMRTLFIKDIVLGASSSITPSPTPGQSGGMALGVYEPAANALAYGPAIDKYTQLVGKKPALAWFAVKWQNPTTGAYQMFDPRLLEQYRTRGITPGLNWDASRGKALNKNQPDFSWQAIISGKHDAYITQVAKDAANYKHPFLVRLFAEMNGNWYPWAYSVNGNTNPADFVTAWKHVVDIFRAEGATNVKFVYCQSALEAGKINANLDKLKQIYPGDDYVDFIALDGYANSRNNWRSLKDEFQPSYAFLTGVSNRPMIFYEVGAAENTNDPLTKANWITQGFLTTIPQEFPKVVAVNWFDSHDDRNIDSYYVNSSENALDAWKEVVASPLYQAPFSL